MIVVGPMPLLASAFSVTRPSGRLSIDIKILRLVIASGVLMRIALSAAVPTPLMDCEERSGTRVEIPVISRTGGESESDIE